MANFGSDGIEGFLDDIDRFKQDVQLAREKLPEAIDEGVEQTSREFQGQVRRNIIKFNLIDTGQLYESIDREELSGPRHRVYTDLQRAKWIEFGTSPHTIRPDEAGALRFTVGGREIIVQQVEHPGTDSEPFFRKAVEEFENNRRLSQNISRKADELFEEVFE